MAALLDVSDVTLRYKTSSAVVTATERVSFTVDRSDRFVLLGPSGCGKSTILKAIAGLLPPTEGEVLVDGKLVTDVGRDRGMVFQAYTSFGWLTVRENVEYGLKLKGMPNRNGARSLIRF